MSDLSPQEKELNERIAKWVWPDGVLRWHRGTLLVSAGDNDFDATFTRSLDALAQYVWPTLAENDKYQRFHLEQDWDYPDIWIAYVTNTAIREYNRVPALACCEAIGKLIGAP